MYWLYRPRFRMLGFFPKATFGRWILLFGIGCYLCACAVFFESVVKPSLEHGDRFHVGADSAGYLDVAGFNPSGRWVPMSTGTALVTVGGNYLGPVLEARVTKSLEGIALVNIGLFLTALYCASKLPGVSLECLVFLLLMDPTLTFALLTANKEIFALLGAVLFVHYVSTNKRSVISLVILIAVSLLARWEQAFVTIVALCFESEASPLRGRRKLALLLTALTITFTYPLIVRTGLVDLSGMIDFASAGNLGPKLNAVQASFGFLLILVPKVLLNLFGHLLSPGMFLGDFLTGDPLDIQNYMVIPLHTLATFVVLTAIVVKHKWDLRKPTIYWCAIYLLVTAVSPVIQPRYQYSVYVILAVELSGLSMRIKPGPGEGAFA